MDSNYSTAYIYGQDGQRSNKYTQSSETLYFNKMWTLHTDSGNNVYGGQTAKNIYLGETRIVTKLNSGSSPTYQEEYYKQYFYHSDHLGSASLVSDYKGDEYQRIEYTPYGETWVEKTSNTSLEFLPYKFTAKELDKETGLYYYGARYLDPKYSRWISTDPALGEYIPCAGKDVSRLPSGGLFNTAAFNLFNYANNNPVKYVDPDGKVPFHFAPLGWSHHAPQRIFGYSDCYDAASVVLGFNINGTKLEGQDFTVRMWKGSYGVAGVGGEIGLYRKNGVAMNRDDLAALGIESSSFSLFDNKTGDKITGQTENKPSFWTTAFKPMKYKHKSQLTGVFALYFKSEEKAQRFLEKFFKDSIITEAVDYYWNDSFGGKDKQAVKVFLGEDRRSVILKYGNGEY